MTRSPLLACLALAAACKGDAPPPAPAPAPAPATPPAPEHMERTDDVMAKIAVVLEHERAQRPNPGPTVEAVFGKLGVDPAATKQVVAATVRARYCANGPIDGATIAVCEYASPAEAAAGRDQTRATFAALEPTRLIVIRGATMITVTGRPKAELEARFNPVLDAL
jgi:hypothetical protein